MGGFGWEGGGPGQSGGRGKGVARGGCARGVGLRWEVLGERSWKGRWKVFGGRAKGGSRWEVLGGRSWVGGLRWEVEVRWGRS